MGLNLTKLTSGVNIGAAAQKTGAQNVITGAAKFNTGILDKDTVSFSEAAIRAAMKTGVPFVDKTTQAELHHDINGYNCEIRNILNKIAKGKKLEKHDGFYLELMDKMDTQLAKLPPLEDDFVFWRGRAFNFGIERFNEDFRVIEAAKPGDIIVPDKAYSYGAIKRELAEHWACDMLMEIHTPKGARVSRNLENGGEVVFPRGAEYRLISKEKDEKEILNVVLEYILPEK